MAILFGINNKIYWEKPLLPEPKMPFFGQEKGPILAKKDPLGAQKFI